MPKSATPTAAKGQLKAYREALLKLAAGEVELDLPKPGSGEEAQWCRELLELAVQQARALREARQVLHIADLAVEGLSLEDTLEHIYTGFRDSIPYDRLGCALLSDDGARVVSRWAKPLGPESVIRQGFSASMAGSSLRRILLTGQPRILNDLEAYLEAHPDSVTTRLVLEEGIRSSLTCPLIAQGKHLGFLFFSSWQKATYQSVHQDIFMRIATQISWLIERSRLHDRLEAVNQRLMQAQGELEHQATFDALTGIYNRRAILGTLDARLGQLGRVAGGCSAIMVDVDHFKHINDRFGHQVGDAVLQGIASILAKHLRADDMVGRYGGEEFLIVVAAAGAEPVLALGERLRKAVEETPILVDGAEHRVTVSVGVGLAQPGGFPDTSQLISCADRALYQAKAAGRNRMFHSTTA